MTISEVEKICRDLLQTIYSVGERKVSILADGETFKSFIEEANKLKNSIEEAIKNCHVEKQTQCHPLAHKPIPDDIYEALPSIPEDQRIVHFTYPWNPKGDTYLREWSRHYNGMGKPFTLPTKLIFEKINI